MSDDRRPRLQGRYTLAEYEAAVARLNAEDARQAARRTLASLHGVDPNKSLRELAADEYVERIARGEASPAPNPLRHFGPDFRALAALLAQTLAGEPESAETPRAAVSNKRG